MRYIFLVFIAFFKYNSCQEGAYETFFNQNLYHCFISSTELTPWVQCNKAIASKYSEHKDKIKRLVNVFSEDMPYLRSIVVDFICPSTDGPKWTDIGLTEEQKQEFLNVINSVRAHYKKYKKFIAHISITEKNKLYESIQQKLSESILVMQKVPETNPNYVVAQNIISKLLEIQQNCDLGRELLYSADLCNFLYEKTYPKGLYGQKPKELPPGASNESLNPLGRCFSVISKDTIYIIDRTYRLTKQINNLNS